VVAFAAPARPVPGRSSVHAQRVALEVGQHLGGVPRGTDVVRRGPQAACGSLAQLLLVLLQGPVTGFWRMQMKTLAGYVQLASDPRVRLGLLVHASPSHPWQVQSTPLLPGDGNGATTRHIRSVVKHHCGSRRDPLAVIGLTRGLKYVERPGDGRFWNAARALSPSVRRSPRSASEDW